MRLQTIPRGRKGGAITRPTLILTRPAAQAEAFARAFRDRFEGDWPVIACPLTETRYLDAAMELTGCTAVIFTSANAVTGFCRLSPRRDLEALCVGARTAEVARRAGFAASEGPGDAEGLARQIVNGGSHRRLAYPHGAEIAFDMEGHLAKATIDLVSAVVYDQVPCAADDRLLSALGGRAPLLLPLFSPASARRAAEVMAGARAPLLVAAMSERVARAALALDPAAMRIAERPDAPAMLTALGALIAASGSA